MRYGVTNICLVDAGAPLSLTSDKSTECYRNWWPGPGSDMIDFTNRSIDLLEQIALATDNRIAMSRRGYAFATADPATLANLRNTGKDAANRGAGQFREHTSVAHADSYISHHESAWQNMPTGIDLLTDPDLIQQRFPALTTATCGLLHARRCGWISAQQLGAHMLEEARAAGVQVVHGKLTAVSQTGARVSGVKVDGANGLTHQIETQQLVLSPGPYLYEAGRMLGLELPVSCEAHVKVVLRDSHNAMPADSPLLSWCDPVELPWTTDEKATLAEHDESKYLVQPFPAGVHGRPMGSAGNHYALMLWTYDVAACAPNFPMSWDAHMPEIIIRGMSRMLPGMKQYFDPLPGTVVDGGYYTKTPENRPLIGPLPVEGAYVNAAYSGYGIMTSCAGGELLAAHVTGAALPSYAQALAPARYDDRNYLAPFADAMAAGQM